MPWLGASPSRTLRGMTVRNTFSLKNAADVARDLLPEIRALVEHRQQHALDVEGGIERGAHAAHGADEIGEPFEREVLAVQRNQHGVGGDERVERQQAERRRAVDEDVVVIVRAAASAARAGALRAAAAGTSSISAPVRLRSAGMSVRRSTPVGMMNGRRVGGRLGGGQRVVDGAAWRGFALLPDAAGEVALRVDVDEQDALVGQRQRGGEVDGGGGLPDAALLIGDGDDSGHKLIVYS